MNLIDDFITKLSKKRNTSTISNPYRDQDLADNLRVYLNTIIQLEGKRILLVGEALGYKGGKLTGIPFSSGQIFERFDHPFLKQIGPQLKLEKIESENTATITWDYLSEKNTTPLFWNSFPFHPHPKGNKNKNRAPTTKEIEMGKKYLRQLVSIYKPEIIAGIGNKGAECVRKAFPENTIITIRHPSYGGKSDFVKGLDEIL